MNIRLKTTILKAYVGLGLFSLIHVYIHLPEYQLMIVNTFRDLAIK